MEYLFTWKECDRLVELINHSLDGLFTEIDKIIAKCEKQRAQVSEGKAKELERHVNKTLKTEHSPSKTPIRETFIRQ